MKFKNILTMLLVCFILSQTLYCSEESLNESLRKIAAEMAAEFKTDSNVIIVASFLKASGEENELGNIISEELITSLYKTKKFSIIERTMLNRVMKEQTFQTQGITDSENASKLGKILGASAICTGTFSEYGKFIKINARMFDTASGKIIAASSAQFFKEEYTNAFIQTNSTVDISDSRGQDNVSQSDISVKKENKTSNYTEESNELFSLMQNASVSNLPSAQFKLGYMYYYGDGVEVDYEQAYYWFEKAAQNEHVEAISWMGYMNMFGYGKDIDYSLAHYWFKKGADYNDSYSENKLGELYFDGYGVKSDYFKAFNWFKKAADKSNVLAMSWVGYCYEMGYGTAQNYENAYNWYLKAANLYDNYSENKLGEFFYNGYFVQSNMQKAFEWFSRSALSGNIKAKSWLGYMYLKGYGTAIDIKKAIEYFEDASNQNDSYSQRQLGDIYFNGNGVPQNYNKAFEFFQKSADNGDSIGKSWLGYIYRYGYGTNIDYNQSLKWFLEAAEEKDGYSNYMLGDIYDYGMGNIKSDSSKAQEYYKKAVEYGYTNAEKRIKK